MGNYEIYKFAPLLFILVAAIIVFGAKYFVRKYKLDTNVKCGFVEEMSEEELEVYKFDKAVVNLKIIGMFVATPGIVLILVIFR